MHKRAVQHRHVTVDDRDMHIAAQVTFCTGLVMWSLPFCVLSDMSRSCRSTPALTCGLMPVGGCSQSVHPKATTTTSAASVQSQLRASSQNIRENAVLCTQWTVCFVSIPSSLGAGSEACLVIEAVDAQGSHSLYCSQAFNSGPGCRCAHLQLATCIRTQVVWVIQPVRPMHRLMEWSTPSWLLYKRSQE